MPEFAETRQLNRSAPLISVVVCTYQRNDLLARCLRCLAAGCQEGMHLLKAEELTAGANAPLDGEATLQSPRERDTTEKLKSERSGSGGQRSEVRSQKLEVGALKISESQHLSVSAFPSYEVVVTDDGRKTTAQQMIFDEFPWVRWVEGPHRGRASNVNNGARHARGTWLAVTDDDCVPSPGWLSGFAAAIVPDTLFYEGRTTCEHGTNSPLEFAPVNLQGGYVWGCNFMVLRSLFLEIGGYDENFRRYSFEDIDLHRRMKGRGHAPNFVPAATVDHPPRRLPWGKNFALDHENRYYYASLTNGDVSTRALVLGTIKTRVRPILRHQLQPDSLIAVASMFSEIYHTLIRIPEWRRKYGLNTTSNLPVRDTIQAYNKWHSVVHGDDPQDSVLLQQWHVDALRLAGHLSGLRVLEVGCGAGDFSIKLDRLGARVTGIDFSAMAIEIAKGKALAQSSSANFLTADAQDLPFASGDFDLVISCECLEHVPNPGRALAEMSRVLKPTGGRLVLTTENYSNGTLVYWIMAWISKKPFDSGAGVQPVEHFFLYWRVVRMMRRAGFRVRRMLGAYYVFLAIPGTHPNAFVRQRIASPWLSTLLRPFARHISFEAEKL